MGSPDTNITYLNPFNYFIKYFFKRPDIIKTFDTHVSGFNLSVITEINFPILTSPMAELVVVAELVEVKPPYSLAFSYDRFDASTSSATTGSTTTSTSINVDFI